jgi:hypothetical protein
LLAIIKYRFGDVSFKSFLKERQRKYLSKRLVQSHKYQQHVEKEILAEQPCFSAFQPFFIWSIQRNYLRKSAARKSIAHRAT